MNSHASGDGVEDTRAFLKALLDLCGGYGIRMEELVDNGSHQTIELKAAFRRW